MACSGLSFLADPLPEPEHGRSTRWSSLAALVPLQRRKSETLINWISARAPQARRVASVCTAAFLLGAAGLLKGRRAVTHWDWCGKLSL